MCIYIYIYIYTTSYIYIYIYICKLDKSIRQLFCDSEFHAFAIIRQIYKYIYIYIYEVKLLIAYELDSQNSLERVIIKVNVFITSGKQKVSLDNLKIVRRK